MTRSDSESPDLIREDVARAAQEADLMQSEARAFLAALAAEGLLILPAAEVEALRRLIVRAHRHLVMRGAPEKGEATYLKLLDDLLPIAESAAHREPGGEGG